MGSVIMYISSYTSDEQIVPTKGTSQISDVSDALIIAKLFSDNRQTLQR
jgi:hypothetical protein